MGNMLWEWDMLITDKKVCYQKHRKTLQEASYWILRILFIKVEPFQVFTLQKLIENLD